MEDKKTTDVSIKDMSHDELIEYTEKLQADKETLKNSVAGYDKGVQKITKEKKLLESAIEATKVVAQDNSKLIDIYNDDPEVGQKVLAEMFDGISIDEYKKKIGKEGSPVKSGTDYDTYKKFREKEKIEERIEKVKNQLPEDLQVKFEEELTDFIGDRDISSNQLDKFINSALSNISSGEGTSDVDKARIMAMGGSKQGKKSPRQSKGDKIADQGMDILKAAGIIR